MSKNVSKRNNIPNNSIRNNGVSILARIRSKYIMKKIIDNVKLIKKYEIFKYNKILQEKININIKDYKEFREKYSPIELELTLINNSKKKFVNIKDKKDLKYFHIFINNGKKETDLYSIYKMENIIKIKIIIDYQINSFQELFFSCNKIEKIKFTKFYRNNIINMESMFDKCRHLKSIDLRNFNTVNVTSMEGMFYSCVALKELDLSSFNTTNVTSMIDMFYNCYKLEKINLSSFNTEKLVNTSQMFAECPNLKELDLSSFKTDNLTNTESMFMCCCSLELIKFSKLFTTKNVISMNYMFAGCNNLKESDLSSFTSENLKTEYGMFNSCYKLEKLNLSKFKFNTPIDINGNAIFYFCFYIKEIIVSKYYINHISIIQELLKGNRIEYKIIFSD